MKAPKQYAIYVRNAKTNTIKRAYPTYTWTKQEAARRATNLDMKCPPHLCYFTEAVPLAREGDTSPNLSDNEG